LVSIPAFRRFASLSCKPPAAQHYSFSTAISTRTAPWMAVIFSCGSGNLERTTIPLPTATVTAWLALLTT
jgi:hypothetical protein